MKNIFILCFLFPVLYSCFSTRNTEESGTVTAAFPDSIASTAEVMPRFQGRDIAAFQDWVARSVTYPPEIFEDYVEGNIMERSIQGRVMAVFFVEKDGSVKDVKILSAPHSSLGLEVKAAILRSPRWSPGYQKGEAVRVSFSLPVDFKLPDNYLESLRLRREAKRNGPDSNNHRQNR